MYTPIIDMIQTFFAVVFKQDVNTIDVVHSTKIHLPPYVLVWNLCTFSYYLCPHTRRYVSVHSITCSIGISRTRSCFGLCCDFVLCQIICGFTNNMICPVEELEMLVYRYMYLRVCVAVINNKNVDQLSVKIYWHTAIFNYASVHIITCSIGVSITRAVLD